MCDVRAMFKVGWGDVVVKEDEACSAGPGSGSGSGAGTLGKSRYFMVKNSSSLLKLRPYPPYPPYPAEPFQMMLTSSS